MPGKGTEKSDEWDSASKFALVLETVTPSEAELAEYCRRKGLFVAAGAQLPFPQPGESAMPSP